MMRSLVLLSFVGAAIYALLLVANSMMSVTPADTKAEVVARETRLRVGGRSLPSRPLRWLATTPYIAPPQQEIGSRENAAVRSPPAPPYQTVTTSDQSGKRLASIEEGVAAREQEGFWFVASRAAW